MVIVPAGVPRMPGAELMIEQELVGTQERPHNVLDRMPAIGRFLDQFADIINAVI